MAHVHSGKSSENMLDIDIIIEDLELDNLDIVLDAGCGDGYFSEKISGLVNEVYALDSHEPSINIVKEKNIPNLNPILASLDSIPLDDESIDIIYLSNVFHGFNDDMKPINELKRILRVGGKIAIVEFKKEETNHGPPLEIRKSVSELISMLKMDFISSSVVGKEHYLAIFKKI